MKTQKRGEQKRVVIHSSTSIMIVFAPHPRLTPCKRLQEICLKAKITSLRLNVFVWKCKGYRDDQDLLKCSSRLTAEAIHSTLSRANKPVSEITTILCHRALYSSKEKQQHCD